MSADKVEITVERGKVKVVQVLHRYYVDIADLLYDAACESFSFKQALLKAARKLEGHKR